MDQRDVEEHLRGASDAIMLLIGEVQQLESHKRGVKPADPRFYELAVAVRDAAQSLAEFAVEEEEWARSRKTSEPDVATIARSQSLPRLAAILERWRQVERDLATAEPGSPDAKRLFEEFQRVRQEYLAAFQQRESDR